jgi:hypothetical protein
MKKGMLNIVFVVCGMLFVIGVSSFTKNNHETSTSAIASTIVWGPQEFSSSYMTSPSIYINGSWRIFATRSAGSSQVTISYTVGTVANGSFTLSSGAGGGQNSGLITATGNLVINT